MIGMVFSISVNERRQQLGVLRALGFKRGSVLQTLLAEGAILALSGGVAGIVFFLLPAVPVALENYGKKCPFVITLLAFLLVLVMFLGTLNFNGFELRTILQALLFAILLGLLGFFGINRLRKKKSE